MDLFAKTEVPSLCLRDRPRTESFRDAIRSRVKRGDVVLELGSGSGILSLFAAQAGAAKVFAIEADRYQVEQLRLNAKANGFEDVIIPIHGDARTISIPEKPDVLIAEMIDTWLLDEHQIPAIQSLHEQGILKPTTQVIPGKYEAVVTFGYSEFSFYGLRITYPLHDWPDLDPQDGWCPTGFVPLTSKKSVFEVNFCQLQSPHLDIDFVVAPQRTGTINSMRLSAIAYLTQELPLASTLTFNGEKILPISPFQVFEGVPIRLKVSALLGGGLQSLQVALLDDRPTDRPTERIKLKDHLAYMRSNNRQNIAYRERQKNFQGIDQSLCKRPLPKLLCDQSNVANCFNR
jgi:SAM-dependent methyltransferase